ncbi:hypothetical protein SAMN06296008_1285 [Polynucleobacter kasalickyi]|uniref:Uncharacterized protein n=1 Tax=Polynucleobacter kasalickyi TaxID=1938817 RepID=A0A1W2CVL2_9BURK|nr:hypothetical protein SAMN06296008_1285 [Polynucleobacter kasalickyi]
MKALFIELPPFELYRQNYLAIQIEAKVKEVVCVSFIIGMKSNYSFGFLRYMTKMSGVI